MSLSWRTTRALPYLPTYQKASEWEQNTKPIRGDKHGTKPLGRRDQKYRYIKREANGDIIVGQGSYASSTGELIRFRPNGEIVLTDSYYHQRATEHDIIGEVLGWHTKTHDSRMWVNTQIGWLPLRQQRRHYIAATQQWAYPDKDKSVENVFVMSDERPSLTRNKPTMLNPNYTVAHRVNRAGAKAARKKYDQFTTYYAAMRKLRSDIGALTLNEEVKRVFGDDYHKHPKCPNFWGWKEEEHNTALHAMMMSDDPDDQYKALLWFEVAEIQNGYSAKSLLTRVAFYHNYDTCLSKEIITSGALVRDNYAWAMPKQG